MKFGTDISDDDEQWLSKYFQSFSLSSYSKYSDYIILHNLAWH